MGKGMAGGAMMSASGGEDVTGPTPNIMFVAIVCSFSAIGGMLFGYDTGINGGVQVSHDFIEQFCVKGQRDPAALQIMSCFNASEALCHSHDFCVMTKDNGCEARTCFTLPQDLAPGKAWKANTASKSPSSWMSALGYYVGALSAGAMMGALSAAPLADKFGRRIAIAISSAIFVAGTVLCVVATTIPILVIGRVVVGMPIGTMSAVLPMYAAEVAPAHVRGVLASLMQLSIVLGILVSQAVALPVENMAGGWKFGLGIAGVPAAVLAIGIIFLPESPRWLCKFHGQEAAEKSLMTLRKMDQTGVAAELKSIVDSLEAEALETGTYADLVKSPALRQRLIVAFMLQILQQATGVNAIFYFGPVIFADAGMSNPLTISLVMGLANLFGTIAGMSMIERFGRRTLLLFGAGGMSFGMLGSALCLTFGRNDDHKLAGWAGTSSIVLTVIFIINFAYSWGPICWVYPAEIFPMRVRAKAISISTTGNWITNTIFNTITPILVAAFGGKGVFFIFGTFGVICGVFVFFKVPETKGKTLEQIDQMFNTNQRESISMGLMSVGNATTPTSGEDPDVV